MSIAILRTLNKKGSAVLSATTTKGEQMIVTPLLSSLSRVKQTIALRISNVEHYSSRSDTKDFDAVFKVVRSKFRLAGEDFLGGECAPNWELLPQQGNRFYLPNSVGPAWQGASTIITFEAPLETLVDFEGKSSKKGLMLQFKVGECPSLLKKSLKELFSTPEAVSTGKLSLMTLRFAGDNERGARKFVLAAREITARLRVHGYWADFINPFSGKPFYSWETGNSLYEVDNRFRGLNMKVVTKQQCTVICTDDQKTSFSGVIYSNAPSDYLHLKLLINGQM